MQTETAFSGPLAGVKVVEIASIGAGPYCAMLLAELGADVLRLDRFDSPVLSGPGNGPEAELVNRSRPAVGVDLKQPQGREFALRLIAEADVLIEGFRPGAMERLGLGPEECENVNPGLIYGRLTGWGQDGPYAQMAGHDINFVGLAGTLSLIGRHGHPPTPTSALLGDFGGGAQPLALAIVAALFERGRSGRGQVIDAAVVDGAAQLATMLHGYLHASAWLPERGVNIGDSGAPFYDAYETADGQYVVLGAIEPQFYAVLLEVLELDPGELPDQYDRERWPEMKEIFAARVKSKTRDQWWARARGTDACLTPLLTAAELSADPHLESRGTMIELAGIRQPAPAPRLSRTPAAVRSAAAADRSSPDLALAGWGVGREEVTGLIQQKVLAES